MKIVEVKGSFYRIGCLHGEQKKEQIRKTAREGIVLLSDQWKTKKSEILARLKIFLPFFEKYAPHLLEEIRGIADGSGIFFEEVLYLNVRHDLKNLNFHSSAGCTSFALKNTITRDKFSLAGQNKDTVADALKTMFLLRIRPKNGPVILGLTYPGEVGPIGLSTRGMAVFGNSIYPGNWTIGLPHNLGRRMLLESSSTDESEKIMRKMEGFSPGSYMVADRSGQAGCFEVYGRAFKRINGSKGIVVHANHILHPDLRKEEVFKGREESENRQRRLEGLLKEKIGLLTPEDCMGILRDHRYRPQSICRHNAEVNGICIRTVFSLVADLKEMVLYVAKGYPCQNSYEPYSI